MEEKTISLADLLVEWSLRDGAARSRQEIAQLRKTAAQAVRKYFGTLECSAPPSAVAAIR